MSYSEFIFGRSDYGSDVNVLVRQREGDKEKERRAKALMQNTSLNIFHVIMRCVKIFSVHYETVQGFHRPGK